MVQDLDAPVIDVDSVSLFAGDFPDDSGGFEVLHGFTNGRWSQIESGSRVRDGCDRMLSQQVKHAEGSPAFSAEVINLASVLVKQLQNLAGGVRRQPGGLLDPFQEEPQPSHPIALETNGVEAVVVFLAVLFEEQTQVQQGLSERIVSTQDQRDEQASKSAVAIQEWVDRLELDVGQCGFDQCGRALRLIVKEFLQVAHAIGHTVGRRRNEAGVPRPGAAQPNLGTAELSRRFVAVGAFASRTLCTSLISRSDRGKKHYAFLVNQTVRSLDVQLKCN